EMVTKQLVQVIREGQEVSFSFGLNRRSDEIALDLGLKARPGTELEKTIKELGRSRSRFAGVMAKTNTLNVGFHFNLPSQLREAYAPLLDQFLEDAIKKAANQKQREAAEKFLEALMPTFKAGEIDIALAIRGPDKNNLYSLVMAAGLKDGTPVERAVRDLVPMLNRGDREQLTLDAVSVAGTKVHRIDQKKPDPEQAERFGKGPGYLAIRDDAIVLTMGPEALQLMKETLTSAPGPAPLMRFDMGMKAFLMLGDDQPRLKEAVRQLLVADPGSDAISVTLTGGSTLHLRYGIKVPLLRIIPGLSGEGADSQ
ncbi:MAG: hypothetical protein NZ700_06750, partial [Gemmataceae bacterium]|nr:hypothetical protein [Gemmataceae bacterium]